MEDQVSLDSLKVISYCTPERFNICEYSCQYLWNLWSNSNGNLRIINPIYVMSWNLFCM